MNARLFHRKGLLPGQAGTWRSCGAAHRTACWRVELIERALLLTLTPDQARAALGPAGETLWPSAAFRKLAEREAVQRTRWAPDRPRALCQLLRDVEAARAAHDLVGLSRLLFELSSARVEDPVMAQRVVGEVDSWVYGRVAHEAMPKPSP